MTLLKENGIEIFGRKSSLIFSVALLIALWIFVFFASIKSAVQIWYISEIFNHCFFIIPGSLYLIYRQRAQFNSMPINPNYWVLIPIIGLVFVYALGLAGDLQLFMHVATFGLLPFIVWMLVGNQITKTIIFPLFFIVFAIPVGEELIPWLQQVTANISVYLLALSGIPVFKTGLYIEVPGGKFLVAEACSGISFFIASIVIGSLYSHLNIVSYYKKCIFIFITITYPILANAVRVYGIITTAYLTDMEYAVGADHLIYGGVFFAIVIISLLFIGEFFRDKKDISPEKNKQNENTVSNSNLLIKPILINCLVMLGFYFWFMTISSKISLVESENLKIRLTNINASITEVQNNNTNTRATWSPKFSGIQDDLGGSISIAAGGSVDFYMAVGKGELISSFNRLYFQERWTIIKNELVNINTKSGPKSFYFEAISNSDGQVRYLASWYVIGESTFANKRNAKLYQILLAVSGRNNQAGLVALSQNVDLISEDNKQRFLNEVQNLYIDLSESFPQENTN